MDKRINWLEIIEEESDNISDALTAIYFDACCLSADNDICQVLKMDSDGTLIHHTISAESTSSAVWTGDAIELARLTWFNPLDDTDEAKVISEYLTKEELQNFTQYLNGEQPTLKKLREWNQYIADRLEKKFTEKYSDENGPIWAAKVMEDLRKHATAYDYEEKRKAELADLGKS